MRFSSPARVASPPVPEPVVEQPQASTPQLVLSQSLIRAIEQETMCPQFYKEYHWLGIHRRPPTPAQQLGQYFEWLAFNNRPRGGEVVVPANTSRGKSADTVRIERQAERVVTLLERYDMHVVLPEGHDYPSMLLQMPLEEYPDIVFEGTFDAIMSSHFEPGVFTVLDLKATKALNSRFGPNGKPGWGDFYNMDHIQPHSYLWLARTHFPDRTWRFRYAVFSYDTGADYEIFEVEMGSLELQELKQRVNLAAHTLTQWHENNFEPRGHPDCCTRCVHRRTCTACTLIKPIKHFKKY